MTVKAGKIRVRFAPSPTGLLPIGGARTALYNWLLARRHGGTFILRIEDTDRTRSTQEATDQIIDSLEWLGLDWDEGPIHQSDRLDLYCVKVEELLSTGRAYQDEDERGRAVRLRVSRQEPIRMADLIHGEVTFERELIEDFVIRKADAFPTYNFACVVDDHEMGITHVVRGDDHISNTPRQLLIYEALGWELPLFAHVPMILGQDGQRLSKRHGATGVDEYRDMGILPEALVNFLALLGWSPGEDREIMTSAQMVAAFDLDRVRRTASQFDAEKLSWVNSQHMQMLEEGDLANRIAKRLRERFSVEVDEGVSRRLAGIYRVRTFADLDRDAAFLFTDALTWDAADGKKALSGRAADVLRGALAALEGMGDWTAEALEKALRGLASSMGTGFKKVAQPVRYAVTGRLVSPPLFDALELVGQERVLARLRRTLTVANDGAEQETDTR